MRKPRLTDFKDRWPASREAGHFVLPRAGRTFGLASGMAAGSTQPSTIAIPPEKAARGYGFLLCATLSWLVLPAIVLPSIVLPSIVLPWIALPEAMEARAQAQSSRRAVPLPPRRPAHLAPAPQPRETQQDETSRPDFSKGAGAEKPSPVQRKAPAIPVEQQHPLSKPGPMIKRRAAVRACYEEWAKMKKDGRSAGNVWRDFSMECLTRKKR